MVTVPRALLAQSINAYSSPGQLAKAQFHRAGKAFLKDVAKHIAPALGSYTLRSNLGGMAVSGEVTLHGENLYLQLFERATSRGVRLLYRLCESQKDYTGGRNHEVSMQELTDPVRMEALLKKLLEIVPHTATE